MKIQHNTTRVGPTPKNIAKPPEGSDRPGTFVTIEGIDGAGKSTVMRAIRENFKRLVTTSEPSGFTTGDWVYQAIKGHTPVETTGLADFYLYMADRAQHIEETIEPALDDGCLVVSDRYADSTRAYQYHALKQHGAIPSWEVGNFIESTMAPWNLEPDLTIYLDVDAETAIERVDGEDKYEKVEFLRDVRERYLQLFEQFDRMVRVDTTGLTPEEVAETVVKLVDNEVSHDVR